MENIVRELDAIDQQLEQAVKRMEKYWVHEFIPHRCPFCKGAFSTKSAFKRHLKSSKKCKELRGHDSVCVSLRHGALDNLYKDI